MKAMKSVILTLCVIGLALAEQSPVFLWGANSEAKPSLTTVRGEEFAKLVTPLLADKALVVFLENDLTNKDFLCTNADDGKSCFARLQGVSGKTFYAAVENPVDTLRTIDEDAEYNTVDASGKFSKPLETAPGKINLVKFKDEESAVRGFTLESHDAIIAAVTSQLEDKEVFFMYTSASTASLLKRQRRDTTDNNEGYIFRDGANFLLYFTSLSITETQQEKPVVTVLDISNMQVAPGNSTDFSVTLTPTTGSPLTFDITLAGGYFFMQNVMYNGVKFLSSDVYAPTDFSYFCGNLTLNSIEKSAYSLQWNSLQFQAPFGYTKNETFVFGDAWHCVGFFTGGILSGLLIVALLLTITFIGVCWMMDINTMDRFDDPKGKTITINASD